MIRCPRCNTENEEGSRYCGGCGYNLQKQDVSVEQENQTNGQTKRKSAKLSIVAHILLVIIVAAIAVVVTCLILNRNTHTTTEDNTVTTSEEELVSTEDTQEQVVEEDTTQEESETIDSTQADIDAINTVYFEIEGTIQQMGMDVVLSLVTPVSICAYNENDEKVMLEDVTYLMIESEENLDGYVGCTVMIKGKVEIDGTDTAEIISSKIEVISDNEVANGEGDTTGIHTYKLVVEDCSWQEAFERCLTMGGYLVRVGSYEEYEAIVQQIEEEEDENVHFYLGGRRNLDGSDYYWVDEQNELMGEVINQDASWSKEFWLSGEPSYLDGETQEAYMNMFYYNTDDVWVLNDVAMDITEYYSGKTGYICEFEN